MHLYRYFVSQSSEFCRHNPLCCFSTSFHFCHFVIHSVRKLLVTPSYYLPFWEMTVVNGSLDSSAVQRWDTGWMIGVRDPAGAGNFSFHHRVQTGSGAHPASYPIGTRGSFPGGKAAGREADHSPASSAEVKEWVELYLPSPNTPLWRGAQHRYNLTFYLLNIFILDTVEQLYEGVSKSFRTAPLEREL
jgi:hypothetical protein